MTPGSIVASGSLVSPGGEQGIPGAAGAVPTGTVLDFAGSSAPANFLMCDGSAVSRTTYANLYSVIGTSFGVGDGSTTFNLPDCRSRATIGVGQGTGLSNRVLGDNGGEETHLLSAAELASHSHTIPAAQFAHNHAWQDAGHTHNYAAYYSPGSGLSAGSGAAASTNLTSGSNNQVLGSIAANTLPAGNTAATAAGTTHNNMQPFVALTKIIKT